MTEAQVISALTSQIRDAKLYPIFFGSAMTGVGVAELLRGVAAFFPVTHQQPEDAPLSGRRLQDRKRSCGRKDRLRQSILRQHPGQRICACGEEKDESAVETPTYKVKKLHLFRQGKTVQSPKVGAGESVKSGASRISELGMSWASGLIKSRICILLRHRWKHGSKRKTRNRTTGCIKP